jgi:DNA-binding NtrC family response regulator
MAPASADSSQPASKRMVLIVDDDEGMRDLLKTILEADYHVTEADSGVALQLALEKEAPDVVLLDMHLPDANGLRLLPAIKLRWPATEVIMLSGSPNDSGAKSWSDEAVRNGAFAFLSKSAEFSFLQILNCVSSAAGVRRGA